jgi:hypothetical protein
MESTPPPEIAAKMQTVSLAYAQKDYALFCSVMSNEMKAKIPNERFDRVCERLSACFKSNYQLTYMGSVKRSCRPVYFWRLWVEGWDSDLLVRMTLNDSGLIAGLLYSDPFDTAMNSKR